MYNVSGGTFAGSVFCSYSSNPDLSHSHLVAKQQMQLRCFSVGSLADSEQASGRTKPLCGLPAAVSFKVIITALWK